MPTTVEFNSLLVPIDFSQPSRDVLDWALQLVEGESPTLVLVHVVDAELVKTVVASGFGTEEEN